MSALFDSTASGSQAGLITLTIPGVVAANQNRYLGTFISYLTFGVTLNSVTWNGTPLTLRLGPTVINAGVSSTDYWDLGNPASGSFNLVATFSAATDSCGGLQSTYNVDQSNPRSNTATNTGTSTAPTVTVTSAVRELVLSGMGCVGVATITPDATWTSDWNIGAVFDPTSSGAHIPGSASITRTDTLGASAKWVSYAVSLREVQTLMGQAWL